MCGGVKQLASRVGGVSHSLFSKPNKAQVVWEDFTRERLGILFFHTRVYLSLFLEYIRYSSYIRISTITRIKVYIWLMFVVATRSFIWMNFFPKIEQIFVKFCTKKTKFSPTLLSRRKMPILNFELAIVYNKICSMKC
jgi:hypothetical protein